MSATISVIIPHLNQPEHLERCLTSLARQAYAGEPIEIIVVDNGSSDLPDAICGAFDGVRLECEATPGPGPARNRGVAASRGSVLAFIDADCIADEGWLAAIDAAFAEPQSPIVGGDVRIAYENPDRMTALEAYESVFAYRQREYIERQNFSGTGNLAMRREVFDAVGPFAGIEVAEDRDWGHRATALGYRIDYLPGMVVRHPARKSFAELRAKWDRQVAHDFEEYARGPSGRIRWCGRIIGVLGSPVLEIGRIARSPRVRTWRERWLAWGMVARIRVYRARLMLTLLVSGGSALRSGAWNRG